MTGVVVVSHGNLGNTFKNEIENILDHPVRLKTVAVSYRASVEHTLAVIHEAIRAAVDGQGVLLLTDLPGATPHNLACQAAQEQNIPVVSGVNLSMLLKVLNHCEKPPHDLAGLAARGGRQGILQV